MLILAIAHLRIEHQTRYPMSHDERDFEVHSTTSRMA